MPISFPNLLPVDTLVESDKILVQTVDGLKQIPAEALGIAVSPTSLFDTLTKGVISTLDTERLSTSSKITRYYANDTSDEVYLEINKNKVEFKKGTVYPSATSPETVHATDINGKLLYWSDDPKKATWSNGLPWKNQAGKKMFITYEETPYLVNTFRYLVSTIKTTTIQDVLNGEPTVQEVYQSGQDDLKGIIIKSPTDFIFKVTSSKGECGLKLVRNTNGSLAGELIGSWAGLNDISTDQRLTKANLKEFWYTSQDYYTYITAMKLDTSDKIGWYLANDTTNKVYAVMRQGTMVVYLAIPKINAGTGSNVKEQASNIFGNKLYWMQDMDSNSGVTNENIPLKSGRYTYMTIDTTAFPVWIWQYDLVELMKFQYDSVAGIKHIFSDASGNTATVYKSSTGLTLEYKAFGMVTPTQLVLNQSGGELFGNWAVNPSSGSRFSIKDTDPPEYEVITPVSGAVSIALTNQKTFIINQTSGSLNINVSIPAGANKVMVSKVLIPSGNVEAKWSSNVKGQELEVSKDGNTEYQLTAYRGYNTTIYVQKSVYGS